MSIATSYLLILPNQTNPPRIRVVARDMQHHAHSAGIIFKTPREDLGCKKSHRLNRLELFIPAIVWQPLNCNCTASSVPIHTCLHIQCPSRSVPSTRHVGIRPLRLPPSDPMITSPKMPCIKSSVRKEKAKIRQTKYVVAPSSSVYRVE